jgi:phage terminase large subunit-like protein
MKRGFDYADDVLSGKIPSCIHVRNACQRFKDDLQRDDLVFREDEVQIVIDFISHLKHFTGKHADKNFILEPWQVFIVMNLYGFYWKGTTQRRFNTAYIEMARKNGKTAFSSALALYHLIADGEANAQVLLAANSKEQAKIAYDITRKFTKKLDPGENYLRTFRADILFDAQDSMLKVLAADADKLDGWNASFCLVDEYHSAPTPRVRDVLRSSSGMRENPLLVTITTAGFDKSLPCYELRTVSTEVVSGLKKDDSFFAMIYTLDQGDDWADEANWGKPNPNLDVTVNRTFLRKQVLQAKNSPSDEVGVRTKNFNEWMDSATTWIPDDYIIKATKAFGIEEFKGEDCYVGVDLASNVDLTAVSYLFVRDGKYYFKNKYYLPDESLKTRADRDLYKQWKREFFLTTTSGNVTDYDYITRDMLDMWEVCDIKKVFYDRYNSTQWAVQATEERLPLEPYGQTVGNFNAPTRELERLLLSGKVVLDDNPINRFCLRNVELKYDYNANCKPNKGMEKRKIDGVIAMIQALAAYLENDTGYIGQIY